MHSTATRGPFAGIASAILRLVRHRWSETQARRALPAEALQRLTQRIASSERQHTGQICIVAETSLPWSYLRRHATARERAIMLFSKQRIWDTEHNNGVLIYLLMPERAIEIVADRGLARHVKAGEWDAVIARMSTRFRNRQFEDGLSEAVDAVSERLARHFPRTDLPAHPNELPDEPQVR